MVEEKMLLVLWMVEGFFYDVLENRIYLLISLLIQ